MAVSRLTPQDPRRTSLKSTVARACHALRNVESLRRAAQLAQQSDPNPGLVDRIVGPDHQAVKLALAGVARCAFGDGGAEFMSVGSLMAAGGFGMAVHSFTCAAAVLVFREALRNSGKDPAAMARHAVAVSAAAGRLAEWGGDDVTAAKVAGALHNLGLAVMIWSDPGVYGGASSPVAGTEAQIHELEADLIGYDHQETGALFLRQLGFAPSVCDAVAAHHRSDASGLAKTVHVADLAAHQMGCDLGFANAPGADAHLVFDGLGESKIAQLAETVSAVTLNFNRLKE